MSHRRDYPVDLIRSYRWVVETDKHSATFLSRKEAQEYVRFKKSIGEKALLVDQLELANKANAYFARTGELCWALREIKNFLAGKY